MEKESVESGTGYFKAGLWGSIVTAICCFTPALVIILGFLGLTALTSYLDYVLMPLLGVFLFTAYYGWSKRR